MSHPYRKQPDYAFWNRSVALPDMADIDPVVNALFYLHENDKIATAGSCFAQHIARYLKAQGFNYFITETEHPITPADMVTTFNYGVFTARYGNIYTSRQALQLFKRAYGEFQPEDDCWMDSDGHFIDPFRPQIQPEGFASRQEFDADRAQHFRCVRRMFEELDVFIFTLGLTECWISSQDEAAYPLCPGVSGGVFDARLHKFINLSVVEITSEMLELIDRLRAVNPHAKVILTVSPVPLVATASNSHVLVANSYSKSVLRVAADQVAHSRPQVAYFPAYEIITGHFHGGRYFSQDLRSVTEEGINHVMRLFLKHYAGRALVDSGVLPVAAHAADEHSRKMAALVEVNCDEVALDSRLSL